MAISADDNTEILAQIWDKLSDFIPEKKKSEAALVFFSLINEDDTLNYDEQELADANTYLNDAYEEINDINDAEDEEVEELDFE